MWTHVIKSFFHMSKKSLLYIYRCHGTIVGWFKYINYNRKLYIKQILYLVTTSSAGSNLKYVIVNFKYESKLID